MQNPRQINNKFNVMLRRRGRIRDHAVVLYVRYGVSYRDLQEITAERGVCVDHATLNRWEIKYAPKIAAQAQIKSA